MFLTKNVSNQDVNAWRKFDLNISASKLYYFRVVSWWVFRNLHRTPRFWTMTAYLAWTTWIMHDILWRLYSEDLFGVFDIHLFRLVEMLASIITDVGDLQALFKSIVLNKINESFLLLIWFWIPCCRKLKCKYCINKIITVQIGVRQMRRET